MNRIPSPLALAVVSAMSVGLAGCFGGSSSGSSSTNDDSGSNEMTRTADLEGEQTGSFQDAAVEGLTYWTASNGLGQTGKNGSFNFKPGEVVALYLGNELVTLTDAELFSTPMDTLSVRKIKEQGLGHPHEGINVLRLLQTIDSSDEDSTIVVPDSFHEDRNSTSVGLNLAQDTAGFANAGKTLDSILTTAGQQGEPLVARGDAAEHLKQTLANLDNNVIDLRGEWVATSTYMKQFGDQPDSSCVDVGPATWVVGDETVFLHGDELHSETNNGSITCEGRDYGSQDTSDWAGVDQATRNGIDGVEWSIAENGALDFDCGPECTLAELRGTIDDWEETCLANDFYTYKNKGDGIDHFQDADYCEESDDHNGPVVGFSEVTYVDRLGGDRILRLKRDFYASQAPAEDAERASNFSENGFSLDVMNRREALDHTVDLTEGEWEEKLISATDDQTIDGGTYSFPSDESNIALDCAENGFQACTWSELNDSYDDGNGNTVQYIHIRGTDVINWVDGDTVGTLTRNTGG
ncbi:hypothetical protein [Salicola sp. Rm-C-2C1-2]|uniref:hypothetical protein n=1 Tax=Salicola sp. Rm-C-2C1-2 TaxID=3141321 RepID=UPI0032E4EED4